MRKRKKKQTTVWITEKVGDSSTTQQCTLKADALLQDSSYNLSYNNNNNRNNNTFSPNASD